MPPNRSRAGTSSVSVLASLVSVTGAAFFAAIEGVAVGVGEPILVGACVVGIGMIVVALAKEIVAMRDMTIRTHDGLFDPERGVFHVLEKHHARADRHSGAIRAIRDGDA